MRDEGSTATAAAMGFNLIRWFSALSLASIALVSIAMSILLSRFLTDQMLKGEAALTQEVIQTIAELENARDYLLNPHPVSAPPEAKAFEDFFNHIQSLPDVLRANIFGADGALVWSSERKLLGRVFLDRNEDLEEALKGKLAIEYGVTGKEEHPKQEHMFLSDAPVHFVESYIPVKDREGRVIGVVELYRIPRAVFETISSGRRLIWLLATLAAVFLYASLFGIVRRADRIIHVQQGRLIESETLAALGEMASAVAHGIRNPLASIRTSAELALDDAGTTYQASARDIMHEVDRLERWIRDLLTYSQPETGSLEAVRLPCVVARSVENFAARRGITIDVEVPDALPAVQADSALLEQVLNSLLSNAVEAMPEGGRLHVRAERDGRPRRVRLAVTDTGVGIPAKQLEKIFTPFHTTKSEGLGVGLSLARRIMRRFGGDITISSQEGQGTTVNLELVVAG